MFHLWSGRGPYDCSSGVSLLECTLSSTVASPVEALPSFESAYLPTCCVCLFAAAAAQEEAEDLSEAQEVDSKEVAVGTLVITHLTQQDLRAKEILLPKQAVEANILPALTYSLLKFKVLHRSLLS